MKIKKIAVVLLAIVLCAGVFAACKNEPPQETAAPDLTQTEPTATEEPAQTEEDTSVDAQTPTPAGSYTSGRCHITVTAESENTLAFVIRWGASAMEANGWEMSGVYDPETGVVEYENCVNAISEYTNEGEETKTVNYENGTGRFLFRDGNLTWEDDQENIADGMVFTPDPSYDSQH